MGKETKTPPKINTQYLRELHQEWSNNFGGCNNCKHRLDECFANDFLCFFIWIEDKQKEKNND